MILYQKDNNSIWYTDDPMFCTETNRQISIGIEVKNECEQYVGLFERSLFFKAHLTKLLYLNEFIFIREIISNAIPTKKIGKN